MQLEDCAQKITSFAICSDLKNEKRKREDKKSAEKFRAHKKEYFLHTKNASHHGIIERRETRAKKNNNVKKKKKRKE